MSESATETTTTADAQNSSQTQPPEGEESKRDDAKTFDADYVAKLRKEAATYRTEAKANADAAKKLQEIEDAQKSELQKAGERLAAAERERDEARVDGLRFRIASEFTGISAEDVELFLTGTDEETLRRQASRLDSLRAEQAQQDAERKKKHPSVPTEGTSTKPGTTTEEDGLAFARDFFSGGKS